MSKSQINGLPGVSVRSSSVSSGSGNNNKPFINTHSTPIPGVGVTAALQCTPSSTNAAAVAAKDHLSVNRLNAGGNASSAPGPGGTNSSPDVEAMREWW